jgi:hypothetical protein
MRDVVEGDLVSLDTLGEGCVDWALVEKVRCRMCLIEKFDADSGS